MSSSAPVPTPGSVGAPTVAQAYSETEAYRRSVVETMTKTEFPLWNASLPSPLVQALTYSHLGLTCADLEVSIRFYAKIGFEVFKKDEESGIMLLRNTEGLELHLIKSDLPSPEGKNVLMDFPNLKPPGHTHASWKVPSVPSAKAYMEDSDVVLSGTRSTLAIFVRDPDRVTLEFERNDGQDEPPAGGFTAAHIGYGRVLDHVGTRIRGPYPRHLDWYSTTLGFVMLTRWYDPDPDPSKNFPPVITRTPAGCELNFIPNCSSLIPETGEGTENILTFEGKLTPGILYVALTVEGDMNENIDKLRASGIDCVMDVDILAGVIWGDFPPGQRALCALPEGPSIMLRDLNGSLWRLTANLK